MAPAVVLISLWFESVDEERLKSYQHSAVQSQNESYRAWSAKQADSVGKSMRRSGRVAAGQGLLHTERAVGYKLRATWLTPEVIRATARLEQLNSRLTDEKTKTLVSEAESVAGTVVMIEIDPVEGSGVIPTGWQSFLQPKGRAPGAPNVVCGQDRSSTPGAEGAGGRGTSRLLLRCILGGVPACKRKWNADHFG